VICPGRLPGRKKNEAPVLVRYRGFDLLLTSSFQTPKIFQASALAADLAVFALGRRAILADFARFKTCGRRTLESPAIFFFSEPATQRGQPPLM
jgi:hypothetical protein